MADAAVRSRAGLGGLARGSALNLAGAAYSALAGFAVAALVARGLGQSDAGVFFTATSAFLIAVVVAKLGTPTGLVYWIARLRALDAGGGMLRHTLRTALTPVLVVSLTIGLALFVAAPAVGGEGFARQVRILAVFVPLAALADALLAATRGYRTMRPTVYGERLLRPTLQLLCIAAVLVAAGPLTSVTLAWAAPYLPVVVLAGVWLARRGRGAEPASTGPSAREFWGFTAPRALASVAQLALQRLDILLVAGFLGFAEAAVYTVATRFLVVGQLGNQALGMAVEPRLAEQLAHGDLAGANTLYRAATAWQVLANWPMYLTAAGFAPLYLSLFGRDYTTGEAVTVVLTLSAAMLVASGCGVVDVVLAMAGRTTWNLVNVLVALAVNVVANLVLIPRIGIAGAAIAWAAAVLIKNLLPLAQIARGFGLHPFGRGTLIAIGLALACVGVTGVGARAVLGSGVAGLIAALVAGGLAYVAGCWLFRHPLALPAFAALTNRREPS